MRIPGFSFWALVTAAIVYFLLHAVALPMETAFIIAAIWYILGVGAASAVFKYHHPELDLPESAYTATFVDGAMVPPPGTFAVTFANQNRTIFVPQGGNLRAAAQAQGVQVYYDVNQYANCRGLGLCGTCRYSADAVASAALSEPTWQEKFTLGTDVGKVRLACQTSVLGNCTIDNRVAEESGEVQHYALINGALLGVFSVIMLGVLLWMGGDMIGLF